MTEINKKEITDYFRSNIFESLAAYTGWKIIKSSKSNGIVSQEMAERYVGIQKDYPIFFNLTEQAFLVQFVMLSLHSLDSDTRSHSLYKVDEQKTKAFIQQNKKVLDALFDLRNKLFAHKDATLETSKFAIPSINDLDHFFKNLMTFYNELTAVVDDSSTIFSNAEEIKHEMEYLFMNLYRGEHFRKLENEIEWSWEKSAEKVSDMTPDITR
ncbi:MAG: hypothetical protein HYY92_02090 [Parcubacteria group bacterium]|nr:hypothetical protein [Parcubacteria group bacterium]